MVEVQANIAASGEPDPNVKLPPSVAAAAAAANDLHKQTYQPPEQQAAVTAPVTDPDQEQAAPQPPAPQQNAPVRAPVPESGEPGSWEHRFHAMRGRYEQSQTAIGQMQEQLAQMGDELVRSQQHHIDKQIPRQDEALPAHVRLTEADMQTLGPDLIGIIQRAALDAVAPELGKTVRVVKQTQQRVAQTAAGQLYQALDREVPDWRSINTDPAFRTWCGLPDVYSGVLRGKLLKDAFTAAHAPRVVAFFKGYQAEQQATGQLPVPVQDQQQAQPAPRQAAVALDSLVAPGRAKPAPGETFSPNGSADKPIFTRADISNFYRLVRSGHYNGREADKSRDEAMIFSAQREGRVKG